MGCPKACSRLVQTSVSPRDSMPSTSQEALSILGIFKGTPAFLCNVSSRNCTLQRWGIAIILLWLLDLPIWLHSDTTLLARVPIAIPASFACPSRRREGQAPLPLFC